MQHVNWNQDVYAPLHKPQLGDRIFVTATEELVTPELNRYMDKHCPDGFYGKSREEAFQILLEDWTKNGAPWIVEVTG